MTTNDRDAVQVHVSAEAARALADALAIGLVPHLEQIARTLAEPTPAIIVPSDVWRVAVVEVPPGPTPTVIAAQADAARLRVTIINQGPDVVYIGPDRTTLVVSTAIPLAVGASFQLASLAQIAGMAATTASKLTVLSEYRT